MDHYVIALTRAREERAKPFLTHVLLDDEGKKHHVGVRFHAAVGLANLGEGRAVEWLIEHSEKRNDHVYNAWPGKVCDGGLSPSCIRALQYLTGQFGLSTKAEFQKWWSENDTSFRADIIIHLFEQTGP